MKQDSSTEHGAGRKAFNQLEAGRQLGVSDYTVRRLIREKRLHYVRLGRRMLISQKSIDDFLAGRESR